MFLRNKNWILTTHILECVKSLVIMMSMYFCQQSLRGMNAFQGFFQTSVLRLLGSHTLTCLMLQFSLFLPRSVCEFLQHFPFTGICSNIQRLFKQYMLCFSGQDIADELREKVVLTLQQAVGVAESNRLADTYLRLARFCHQLGIDTLSHQECQVSFTQNFTQMPTYSAFIVTSYNPVFNLIILMNW